MVEESESDPGPETADESDRNGSGDEREDPRSEPADQESNLSKVEDAPRSAEDTPRGAEGTPQDVEGSPQDADGAPRGAADTPDTEDAGPDAEGDNLQVTEPDAEADLPTAEADRPAPAPEEPEDAYEPAGGPDDGGPPDDEEMPLTQHIEEMVLRLAAVLAIAGLVTAIAFPFAQEPISFIWYSLLPETVEVGGETISTQPRVYGPLELKLMELKLASLAGLVAALPMGVYQTYRFMRPGLYPHERRYYLAAIPTSLILAFVGIAFAFFIVLPAIFTYFLYYSENAGEIAFALQQTFNLIIILKAFMAMVFQIPLLIMLAIMMGVTTRRWLENRRLYFWAGFLGIAFLFSPDPTGMAPLLVAATMVVLFEGTLTLLRWTGN